MTRTVRELHNGPKREVHSTNLKAALAEVLEDLIQVDGLLARCENELLKSAGPIWEQKGLAAILDGTGLPAEANAWRTRYLLVKDWMSLHMPTRLDSQRPKSD